MENNVSESLERDCDLSQLSIANHELCSTLSIIGKSWNDKEKFFEWLNYAKSLQKRLLEMELRLKKELREKQ